MREIAIISDIHGNLPALMAVFNDIEKRNIHTIWCLGDLVGKGPNPQESIDFVKEKCSLVIKGNWEKDIFDFDGDMSRYVRDNIREEDKEYLKSLPIYKEVYISGKLLRICHASPSDIYHRTYVNSSISDREKLFDPPEDTSKLADVVAYGDIHGSHINSIKGRMIFNTGSVGNPLDETRASYAIIKGKLNSKIKDFFDVKIVKINYDRKLAIKNALESNMPCIDEYIDEINSGIYRGHK